MPSARRPAEPRHVLTGRVRVRRRRRRRGASAQRRPSASGPSTPGRRRVDGWFAPSFETFDPTPAQGARFRQRRDSLRGGRQGAGGGAHRGALPTLREQPRRPVLRGGRRASGALRPELGRGSARERTPEAARLLLGADRLDDRGGGRAVGGGRSLDRPHRHRGAAAVQRPGRVLARVPGVECGGGAEEAARAARARAPRRALGPDRRGGAGAGRHRAAAARRRGAGRRQAGPKATICRSTSPH